MTTAPDVAPTYLRLQFAYHSTSIWYKANMLLVTCMRRLPSTNTVMPPPGLGGVMNRHSVRMKTKYE
jgi:hypothetical protein